MKRRLEICRETERLVVLRRHAPATANCEVCGGGTRMVSLEEAVMISGKSQRQLVREIDDKTLHHLETPGGMLLICLKALMPPENASERSSSTVTIRSGRKQQ